MSDIRTLLEHKQRQLHAPPGSFERLLRRRDRRRRNQRILAGSVGIAVFVAAVWIVTTVGSFDRTRTPGAPGPPAPTGATGPSASPVPEGEPEWLHDPSLSRVNLIALPPEGAPPSPDGELVLAVDGRGAAAGRALTYMYLYADGRLIWWREGVSPEGVVFEQRLTPEGVELLRSEVISSGLVQPPGSDKTFDDPDTPFMTGGVADPDPLAFVGSIWVRDGDRVAELFLDWAYYPGDATSQPDAIATAEQERAIELLDERLADPASWLPASAWADQEIRAYVPSRYRVCYGGGPISDRPTVERDRILEGLPEPTQELLRVEEAKQVFLDGGDPSRQRAYLLLLRASTAPS